MSFTIHHGCSKEVLFDLIAKGTQVDSIVTDPPYELGFMGKSWDNTGIANDIELWKLALQVLKPGGHLLAFGGSRTYHRMASAIEDAGFEIRDQIMWLYGQGFPKSLDISKAIDKMEGAERKVIGINEDYLRRKPNGMKTEGSTAYGCSQSQYETDARITAPATESAKQWDGFGSALKPAHEPIVMARKPLSEKNIASNVIKHGTGGINIDGCRVVINKNDPNQRPNGSGTNSAIWGNTDHKWNNTLDMSKGRFPANLIHDGSDEVEAEFAKQSTEMGMHSAGNKRGGGLAKNPSSMFFIDKTHESNGTRFGDKGSASRFFYSAKASKAERDGSKHPTVKPISLMRYLCRLITPPNGVVLDPFAGTGTTGQAAIEEGFSCILIEKEEEYVADIKKRMNKVPLTLWQLDNLINQKAELTNE